MMGRLVFVGDQLPPVSRDFMREVQECCRKIFETILQKRDSMKEDSQSSLISFSNLLPSEEMEEIKEFPMNFSIIIQPPDKIYKIPATEILKPFTREFVNELISATADFLSHFYLSRFRICKKPDCKKYFYQKTEKPMNYCSLSCSNWGKYRNYNQDKRKKNNPNKSILVERPGNSDNPEIIRINKKRFEVIMRCGKCTYDGSTYMIYGGKFDDYLKRYSGPEKCPQCGATGLRYFLTTSDREEYEYTAPAWEELVKKYKFEGGFNNDMAKN
jgi:hypothetical protein